MSDRVLIGDEGLEIARFDVQSTEVRHFILKILHPLQLRIELSLPSIQLFILVL